MLNFAKLGDAKYLFGPNPLALSRSDHVFFWVTAIFFFISIVFKIIEARMAAGSPQKHLFGRFFHAFLTTSILVAIWAGARYENIPWLGTHIVALGLYAIFLVWLGFILKYFFFEFRKQRRTWLDELVKQKYLAR
ncbi:hypothetical protein D4R52_00735 [bacterium]|nr:MAG: hypothetical protein D4R52_00735 [bacterium]